MHKIFNMLTDELKFQERRKEGRDDVEALSAEFKHRHIVHQPIYITTKQKRA